MVSGLQAQLSQAMEEGAKLRAKLDASQHALSDTQSQLHSLRQQQATQSSTSEQSRAQMDQFTRDNSTLRDALRKKDEQIHTIVEEAEAAKSDNARLKLEVGRLTQLVQSVQARMADSTQTSPGMMGSSGAGGGAAFDAVMGSPIVKQLENRVKEKESEVALLKGHVLEEQKRNEQLREKAKKEISYVVSSFYDMATEVMKLRARLGPSIAISEPTTHLNKKRLELHRIGK